MGDRWAVEAGAKFTPSELNTQQYAGKRQIRDFRLFSERRTESTT